MNDLTKKIKTGLKNNPESKKDELIRKAVAAITTAVDEQARPFSLRADFTAPR